MRQSSIETISLSALRRLIGLQFTEHCLRISADNHQSSHVAQSCIHAHSQFEGESTVVGDEVPDSGRSVGMLSILSLLWKN